MINNKIYPIIFVIIIAVLIISSAIKIYSSPVIETNILALLPEEENSKLVSYAEDKMAKNFERRIVILVGHQSKSTAVNVAKEIEIYLSQANIFSSVKTSVDTGSIKSLIEFYKNYSHNILTERQLRIIENNDISSVKSNLISKIYGMQFDLSLNDIHMDPLSFFNDYISETIAKGSEGFTLYDDVPIIEREGMNYAVLRAELSQNPFSIGYQEKLMSLLNKTQNAIVNRNKDIEYLQSGMVFHAVNSVNTAKSEISIMGTISIIGVFLLLTAAFRSIFPFFIAMGVILCGALIGFSVCLLFFDKIHLLTLVFGTSLIGISIDYSLHFFAERYKKEDWQSQKAISNISSGITLGVITSVIGFLGLCFTPFPGLQQIAIFSISGLLFVYCFVLFFYPYLFKSMPREANKFLYKLANSYFGLWRNKIIYKSGIIIFVSLLLISACVFPLLKGKDDVRAMQSLSTELVENDIKALSLLGKSISSQFFIVSGTSNDDLLLNLTNLSNKLDLLKVSGHISDYQSLDKYIIQESKQNKNRELLLSFIIDNKDELNGIFKEIGFSNDLYQNYYEHLLSKDNDVFSINELFENVDNDEISFLYLGDYNNNKVSLVTINQINDVDILKQLTNKDGSIIFVDKVTNISTILSHYRNLSLLLVLGAYILIFFILLIRYKLMQSFLIIAPSLLASLLTLALVVLFHGSYSLFHVIALFLIMGIGVDYGLFIVESKKHKKAAVTAIILSAITTLLSFGLLTTSSTSAIHDFGLSVTIGIIITLFFSPIILVNDEKKQIN